LNFAYWGEGNTTQRSSSKVKYVNGHASPYGE